MRKAREVAVTNQFLLAIFEDGPLLCGGPTKQKEFKARDSQKEGDWAEEDYLKRGWGGRGNRNRAEYCFESTVSEERTH